MAESADYSGASLQSYQDFRNEAIEYYRKLPGEMNELYKKHSLQIPITEEMLDTVGEGDPEEVEKAVQEITFKTGIRFDLIISDAIIKNNSEGIRIVDPESANLENKLYKSMENKFAALANAYSKKVILVDVENGGERRLNILFINNSHLFVQTFLNVGEKAKMDLFSFHASTAGKDSVVANLYEIKAGKEGEANVNQIHNQNDRTYLINLCKGEGEERSKIKVNFVYNGAKHTKSANVFDAKGIGSRVEVSEMVYGTKEQRFDLNTQIINKSEKSSSLLESAAVLDGNAACALKGFAKIEKFTKGAKSRITERGILLSQTAHIDALPDMSIDYSDGVSATHSAATAPIDKEALFYIMSRGVDEVNARRLFVAAFISKYLSNIEDPVAREIASSLMFRRMEDGEFGVVTEVTPRGIWSAR